MIHSFRRSFMRRALVVSVFTLAIASATSAAASHVVRYVSKHPLPKKIGRGFCYLTVPHVHDYEPSDPRLYRQTDGQYYFVGDPAPYDYDGPRYSYYGAHPIADVDVRFAAPTYCYLRGPHYHWYAPPAQAQFELRGGAYWYVGTYDPVYYSDRPRFVVINDVYAPVVYARPVIDVRLAPPAFHGEIVAGGPGWRAGAVVGAPVVQAGVHIAVPPPPVVQVGVGVGVGVGGPPAVVHRHDNGRHNGWYKHGKGWRGPPPAAHGGWRGPPPPPAHRGGNWRGGPPPPSPGKGSGWRGGPAPMAASAGGGSWRGGPGPGAAPGGGGWRGGSAPGPQQKKGSGGWRR
jgi:hypothetical protein